MASSNFTTPRAPSSKSDNKGKITPEAVSVLGRLPGIDTTFLSNWLYSSRLIEDTEKIYWDICRYVGNGQEHNYGMEVINIVRVVRNGVRDFEHDHNLRNRFRMLLWHGTKKANIPAILQNGFMLPNSSGQMFGKGLYFADRISKSANYCDEGQNPTPGKKAFLLLCDVLLGKMYNSKNPKYSITEAPSSDDFDSVMCTGHWVPDRCQNVEINKSILPCGPTIANTKFPSYSVDYNEYIVYDPSKVRVKYLVQVKYHSSPQ